MTIISLIVAHGKNLAIGKDNAMPWHIPEDLKFFKAQTLGKPVIMGRKTFQSIGRPLPGRPNIVVTRDSSFSAEGVTVCSSLDDALKRGEEDAEFLGGDEIMIIGGAQIYQQAISLVDRLYITEIDLSPEADTFFPATDSQDWVEHFRESRPTEAAVPGHAFVILDRKTDAGR
ncbi:dihydrofolate reductase [Kiloniella laminariae]|uniref:dihydrofolate reductase n=1 Tax=Kiloniella laminariae TaxID=454162 RepID=UPI0003764B0A|nr:dihydrofolate reductase [Kiloniella laminariae]